MSDYDISFYYIAIYSERILHQYQDLNISVAIYNSVNKGLI